MAQGSERVIDAVTMVHGSERVIDEVTMVHDSERVIDEVTIPQAVRESLMMLAQV